MDIKQRGVTIIVYSQRGSYAWNCTIGSTIDCILLLSRLVEIQKLPKENCPEKLSIPDETPYFPGCKKDRWPFEKMAKTIWSYAKVKQNYAKIVTKLLQTS